MMLDAAAASAFSRVALANVERPFPHKLDHLLAGPEPRVADHVGLHPAFFGAYDWHSAVHMHWLLVRVLRLHPGVPQTDTIRGVLDRHLSRQTIDAELCYLESPAGRTFERPYGWAWLLELHAELARLAAFADSARGWAAAVEPLARHFAGRLKAFCESATYPIRAGTHANTAFACVLARDYALACDDAPLAAATSAAVVRWYGGDRRAATAFEPSLTDFLSPILAEAVAMRTVLDAEAFAAWFDELLPDGLGPLAKPPRGIDRHDPQIAHLDGLSLSRAWMLTRIAAALPVGHARTEELRSAAAVHLDAGLPWAVGGDYVGEHWLASFAALALGDGP